MSNAELTAHRLYDTMHLDSVSEDVKRHLITLILSKSCEDADESVSASAIGIPQSYEEALQMGATDLEYAREELHTYVSKLTDQYDLQ